MERRAARSIPERDRPRNRNAELPKNLITNVLLPRVPAQLALDVAAPNESTLALLGDVSHPRLVAPAAAQQPASVEAEGRPVTHSPSRTRNAESTADEKKKEKKELLYDIN